MAANTKNTGASSTMSFPASTLEFPPLPVTWEIVAENDNDELALKVTQVMLDSDDEDENEMWETFEHDSKPAYTEVAARGKVYHELQKAGEVMMGIRGNEARNKKAAEKDPRLRREIAMAAVTAAADADADDDDGSKDEYESRKTHRAQKIHHKIVAKKHDRTLGAQLTDAEAKDDAFHKLMPVWETIKDNDDKNRIEKRKAFEINKQLKKEIKSRRMTKHNGPKIGNSPCGKFVIPILK